MPTPDFSAMLRWPNVPACYGWLSLDQRGRWRMRGEAVSHRGLQDFLNRQYAHDEDGNYFVQNGPQRVFVDLDYTPWVCTWRAPDRLETQVGEAVSELRGAAIDEEGNLLLEIPAGIALLCDRDLPALLPCLHLANGEVADDDALLAAIAQAAGRVHQRADARLARAAPSGAHAAPLGYCATLRLYCLTAGSAAGSSALTLRQLALDALLLQNRRRKVPCGRKYRADRSRRAGQRHPDRRRAR
jgi:hypothetical protein